MDPQARRIHSFRGTDLEYIAYLEPLAIAYLESLVPQAAANHSPPSPPRSDVRDEASDSDESPTNSLVLIPYQPATDGQDHCLTRPGKRKRVEPRWERLMDEMISNMNAEDWSLRRRTVGLSSQAEILVALDMMIHRTKPQTGPMAGEADLPMVCYHPPDAVLQLLDAFATTTAALKIQATFTTQMFFFRVFVFVSLCCVALHNGADQGLVDKIMQKCVSESSEKNLARLRNGALWVNRMMAELAADGFDYLAYELFVLWGRSVAQYGRFADAGDRGFSYFKSRVPRCKPGTEIQASLPFWVPFIIKAIVSDVFSLPAICTALGYGTDSRIYDYPRYLDNYHNRRMPLPRRLGTKTTASLTDQSQVDASNGHGGVKGVAIPTGDSTTIRIQALLEAALQSDYLPRSVNDQQVPVAGTSTLDGMIGYNSRPLAGLDLNTDISGWGDMSFFNEDWVDMFPMD